MIISVQDIRKYREIAQNTQQNRIEIFIREVEQLDVLPLLGVEETDRLSAAGEQGSTIELTDEEKMLLDGGTWTDESKKLHRFEGLKTACSYLTFARFIRNHPLQVTPFGVVVKETDESSPASAQSIAGVSKDSEKIGRQYLAEAVKFWQHTLRSNCGSQPTPYQKKKFYPIGD